MTSGITLTKSNFKLGHDCLYKLKYYKAKYPSKLQEDDYLAFFADCGFMVEAIAHALFADGVTPKPQPGESPQDATTRVMAGSSNGVWIEPTLVHGSFMSRIDMLVCEGDAVRLIEIKAKSFDSTESKQGFWNTRGDIASEWKSYLLDVAFQTMVVRAAMPQACVTPELCLVDKSKTCAEEAIYSKIRLINRDDNDRSAPRAVYVGDAAALQAQHFLAFVDVSDEVEYLLPQVVESASRYLEFLTAPNNGYKPPLSSSCKNCEYRGHGKSPDGFAECWGDLADAKPHVLDLFRIDLLGKREGLQKLIELGVSDAREIDDSLVNTDSPTGHRQAMQLKAQRSNTEVVLSGIQDALASCEYPLHFLDFETSSIPVPYHAGMNPYEKVAFQFSCHTIASPGSTELTRYRHNANLTFGRTPILRGPIIRNLRSIPHTRHCTKPGLLHSSPHRPDLLIEVLTRQVIPLGNSRGGGILYLHEQSFTFSGARGRGCCCGVWWYSSGQYKEFSM
jgi:hypothetical protein